MLPFHKESKLNIIECLGMIPQDQGRKIYDVILFYYTSKNQGKSILDCLSDSHKITTKTHF